MKLLVKRAYEASSKEDGFRVLVDRLWPRGVTKVKAKIDLWARETAPSGKLRAWFHADRDDRYADFTRRYAKELKGSPALKELKKTLKTQKRVTIVTGAKDVERSHVPTLVKLLK